MRRLELASQAQEQEASEARCAQLEAVLEQLPAKPLHCSGCGRFLLKHKIILGTVTRKCRFCKEDNSFSEINLVVLEQIAALFS